MWRQRKTKDYFSSEDINDTKRDCISKKTIKEFLDRLALAETWLLKQLLGDNYAIRAAAVNVKVIARKNNTKPETYFGDLYVVQNVKNGFVSFKLYSPKENQFIWTVDTTSNLDGYVDLECNTHVLHLKDFVYTFKFPSKKERILFQDNLRKFLFFEKAKICSRTCLRFSAPTTIRNYTENVNSSSGFCVCKYEKGAKESTTGTTRVCFKCNKYLCRKCTLEKPIICSEHEYSRHIIYLLC